MKGLLAALAATTLALFVMACDETGEDKDGGPSGDGPITQPDSGPPPEGIEFKKANESAELNFESGSEEFLVVPLHQLSGAQREVLAGAGFPIYEPVGAERAHPIVDVQLAAQLVEERLAHSGYEPAFDLDAALQEARDITGRDDAGAHIGSDS